MSRSLGPTAKSSTTSTVGTWSSASAIPLRLPIGEAYNALIPGGILEMQDSQMPIACIDDSMECHPLTKWATDLCRAAERFGCPLTNSRYYGRWMRDAGFVDVVERHFYWKVKVCLRVP
jgi:hypothetical protein